jgi:outer membrane protein assembly factor BamD (BamD/ComL family)
MEAGLSSLLDWVAFHSLSRHCIFSDGPAMLSRALPNPVIIAACAVVLALCAATPCFAQESVEASGQQIQLNDQALEAMNDGNYVRAASLLEEANHLGELKEQMKKSVQKQRRQLQQGGRGMKDEEVKIPGGDDEKSGQKLRDDVMDAMKQEKLDSYESEIERYYKSIME